MTFLSAAQSAAIRLLGRKPASFFTSRDQFEMEIIDLANDVVDEIVRYADWRALIKTKAMPGDGVTMGFDLPDDYARMMKDGGVTRANWYTWGYVDAPGLNEWRDLINGLAALNPGYWIILNGQMQFSPPITNGETAEFYYVSKNAVQAANGTTKPAFTADKDEFLLDERLLTLGLIWRWRAQKRLEYAEDMQSYEIRIAQLSSEDRGARAIAGGPRRFSGDFGIAYPRSLG